MFKNLFKLGKDSSEPSISDKFDLQQKLLSTCSVDYENFGMVLSSSVSITPDIITNVIQSIDRFVIIIKDTSSQFG